MNEKPKRQKTVEEQAYEKDRIFTESAAPEDVGALAVPENSSIEELGTIRRFSADAALHVGDQGITWVKLLQTGNGGADGGKFQFVSTGEIVDSLYIIPTRVQPTLTLWPKGGFSREQKPECSSSDAVFADLTFPDGREPKFAGQACSKCRFFAPTKQIAKQKRLENPDDPRICEAGYVIRGISVSTFEEIGMRLHNSSNKIAPILNRPGVFQTRPVKLSSEWTVQDWGSWFQLLAEPQPALTPEQTRMLRELMGGGEIEAAS
jgi:hypothetical protein